MPYIVRGNKVYKRDSGKLVAKAGSHAKAKAMVRAIYASKARKARGR